MYKYFFIAKNNIKKQKSDMITFLIMSAISAFLIFLSLSFMTGTGKVLDTHEEIINAADILIIVNDNEAVLSKIEEIVKGNTNVGKIEKQRFLGTYTKYRKAGDEDYVEYNFAIYDYEDESKIQTMSIDPTGFGGNDVVLPVSLSISYKIGDVFQLKIGDNVYNLDVAGFNEDNYFCSPLNMGTYKIYVSDKMYETIKFENPQGANSNIAFKVQLSDTARKKRIDTNELSDSISDELLNWYNEYVKENPDVYLSADMLASDNMQMGSMILPLICVAFVFLFALIILAISIVIISFSVKNFIMTNMKNTAIMEASGYTVKELVLILLFQLLTVSILGSIIGVVLGALALDKVSILIFITLGLPWNQPINIAVAIVVIIGLALVVGLLTILLGRDYSKTSVLDALRGGVNTHNYKKNLFAFDKSAFPTAVTLSLKETFGKFKSQIGIIFIMAVLSVSSIVGFGLAESYGTDEGVLELAGLDICDALSEGDESMLNSVTSLRTVKDARAEVSTSIKYSYKKKEQTFTTRCFSDTSNIRGGCILEGRWPLYPNEVMLASNAANKLGVGYGDVVTVKTDMSEESFLVCGICQSMNYMGMMGYMTMDGIERVLSIPEEFVLYINFNDDVTYEEFEKEFKENFPDVDVIDYSIAVHQSVGTVTLCVKSFAIFVSALTIIIVAFVESLIVRTNINKQWRNLGVSKALGFTSRQLIGQVVMSNVPTILMGVSLGLIVSPFIGKNLMTYVLFIFGFKKVAFYVSPVAYLLTALIIIGVALATSAFMGRKIKTLEPVKMIMEE